MLLLGTALASSLIALPMLTANPVQAQTATCVGVPSGGGPTPIVQGPQAAPIICVNGDDRVGNAASFGNAIFLSSNSYVDLTNSGDLQGSQTGIYVNIGGVLTIDNSGSIVVNNLSALIDGVGNLRPGGRLLTSSRTAAALS